MPSRRTQRFAAVALLAAIVAAVGAVAWGWAADFLAGQQEIADSRAQLRDLQDLAEARSGFQALTRPSKSGSLVLAADGNPQDALAAAVAHAAEGQQVIVDGVEPLAADAAGVSAAVRLRATQGGLDAFLRAVETQTPYLTVPRLELTTFRPADQERGKPLVLSAAMRVTAIAAPASAAGASLPAHDQPP